MAESRPPFFPELKITVQNDGTVIAELPETGEKETDGKIDDDPLLLETLKSFRDWLNQGKLNITLEREFEVLGGLLRRLLLERGGSGVRDLVDKKLGENRRGKKPIFVQLEFQAQNAELHSLPWEFLYDRAGKCFFATNVNLVLTRFIPSGGPRQALSPNELPLRLQLVVSKPQGVKSVAAKESISAIDQFAADNSGRIALGETLKDLPFLELQDKLKALRDAGEEPHIVHFIGHGRYNKSKRQGEVALPDPNGDGPSWVDQNQFTRLFTDINCVPRLLFLQLCEGAVVEEAELIASFEGLAPTLLSAGVQAVVAMQFPIKNVHANEICKIFYDELTRGRSIGEAVQTARLRMVIASPVAAGTPVLYMFGFDRPIVSMPSTGTKTGAGRGPSGADPSVERSSAEQGTGPAPAPSRAIRDALSKPPPGGDVSSVESEILAEGDRKIKAMEKSLGEEQRIALNRKLYFTVRPALRGKTMFEIKQVLADFRDSEAGTPLCEVLDEMLNAVWKMS